MEDIICKECGKIFVCFGFHWIEGKRVPCTHCEKICAKCWSKKSGARLELVREMNDMCYPKTPYHTINPSKRDSDV